MGFGCPARHMPADWEPVAPAWSIRFETVRTALVVAMFTVEGAEDRRAAVCTQLDAWLAAPHAPSRVERAVYADRQGRRSTLTLAYWLDPAVHEAWAAQDFAPWWQDPARLRDDVGLALEVLTIPLDRLETIFGTQDKRGAAHNDATTFFGPVREHLYWGAMRDRIPASADDPLASVYGHNLPSQGPAETRGRRLRAETPENLCVIRSGQHWGDCDPEELDLYDRSVRPALHAGMRYLRDHPDETGCIDLRFANEIEGGAPAKRAFGLGFFLSLAHLEAWAAHHPTHLEIFNRMIALATERGEKLGLKLWHEVFVLPKGGQRFEYINCAPGTGLLANFPAEDLSVAA